MASVQVFILRSGRSDAYGLPLTPGSVVTVDRDYAVSLVSTGFASWVNLADAYDGETNLRKPSETYTLFQSGIPFWLPPGNGGANGLSFTGTRGVFTLSAAVLTNFNVLLTNGGYIYLPAGSGGLTTGGLYFCRMSDDTNGEVFQETYSGVGIPPMVSSPTAFYNLTSGRITQTTSEVVMASVTVPGGSMGPNGLWKTIWGMRASSSASNKQTRVKYNGTIVGSIGATTSNNVVDGECIRQNAGRIDVQNGSSPNVGRMHFTSTAMLTGDRGNVDTSVDSTITFCLILASNTDSCLGILRKVSVEYGA